MQKIKEVNMQRKKIKEYILGGIAIFIALFTLIGMAFNLIQIKNFREFEKNYPYTYHDNGFNILDFKSDLIGDSYEYGWIPKLLGAFNLIQLLACVVAIGLVILSFLVAKDKKRVINIIAIIIGVFFSLLYMIEGAVYTSKYNDLMEENYFETVSFVPLIIVAVAVVAYIAVAKLFVVGNTEEVKEVQKYAPTTTAAPVAKKVDVEQIKQLKELLDMGAITQEEYDEKKKEILKG